MYLWYQIRPQKSYIHPPCSGLPPILHPHIERHCSFSSLLSSFYSGLGLPVHTSVYSCRPPPPVPALSVLPPLTFSPGPSWPMQPCAASTFLPPYPLSGYPLSPPLTSLSTLSTPVSNSFQVLSIIILINDLILLICMKDLTKLINKNVTKKQ